jgi:hypothetical protein
MKLFWFFLNMDCDHAGWWNPDWDLVTARLKTELDPEAALSALGGQVKRHASGWWELKGFTATAFPNGLSEKNTFHRSVLKQLNRHARREREHGEQVGDAAPAAGLDTPADAEAEGGGEGATQALPRGSEAPKVKVVGQGHGRSHGPGPEAEASSPGHEPRFPTGGLGGSEAPDAAELAVDEVALERQLFLAGYPMPLTDDVKNTLRRAIQASGYGAATEALAGWVKATEGARRTKKSLLDALRWVAPPCEHVNKTWIHDHLDDYKHGLIRQRWRCNDCQHSEPYGVPRIQKHEHEWGPVITAPRLLPGPDGSEVRVQAFQRCAVCPSERAAELAHEVAA